MLVCRSVRPKRTLTVARDGMIDILPTTEVLIIGLHIEIAKRSETSGRCVQTRNAPRRLDVTAQRGREPEIIDDDVA